MAIPGVERLVISAPFGNYITRDGATSTLGTFTLHNRGGVFYRAWRMLRTLRRVGRVGGWVNRLGLPNPGLQWLREKEQCGDIVVKRKIISVHGFTLDQWRTLIHRTVEMRPAAIELNVSCPNVTQELSDPGRRLLFRLVEEGYLKQGCEIPFIVKVPPNEAVEVIAEAQRRGIKYFHCFNTIPVAGGGLSGEPLRAVYPEMIRLLKPSMPDTSIIGGGGIEDMLHANRYIKAGTDHVAVGSALLTRRGRRGLNDLIHRAGKFFRDK